MDAHIDLNTYHPTFDYNHEIFDTTFGIMRHAVQEYYLSDEIVSNAVHSACDFMHINDLKIVDDTSGTGVYTHNPTTFADDILGFDRDQLLKMGVHDENALSLICTHEVTHCMLQRLDAMHQISSWEGELISDSFMGVRSSYEGMDTHVIEKTLANEIAGPTHPGGELRLKYIMIGQEIGEDLKSHDIPVTFDNVMQRLNEHLEHDRVDIYKQEAIINELANQNAQNELFADSQANEGAVCMNDNGGAEGSESAGGIAKHGITYTESEINERKKRVQNCKEKVNRLEHELGLAEAKARALKDNDDRIEAYKTACREVDSLRSRIHSAKIDLSNAQINYNKTV